jgi:prepilin-type N-terminal cleavage/methylation domain-containing protein
MRKPRGFTLIEFIGALAIVAIMAAALAPTVIKQIDRAVLTQEITNLQAISNAVVLQAIRNKTISSANTWASDAAGWLGLPSSSIATNSRNYGRAFLIDGSGWLGTTALPYIQTNSGTTVPTSARLIIVSAIARGLPASITSGNPGNAMFNDIWNTTDGSKPNDSTWSTWQGTADDVVIQRINLQSLFHRVILYSRDTNTPCFFTIDGTGALPVPATTANQWESYYLHGSVVGMYTNSVLLVSEIANKDMSRVYEAGSWSDQIGPGPPAAYSTNLDQLAYAFVNSSFPPVSKKGDNTLGVADSLLAYLNAYASWANMSPCFSYGGNGNPTKVVEYQLMSAVAGCFGGSASGTCTIVP